MPSIAATEPDFASSNHNLLACLALYQHRQDLAVGIDWLSGRARGLLWYYSRIQQDELTTLMTAVYLNNIIQEKAAQINDLITVAKEAANKQELLRQVVELEQEIDIAKAMLDDLEKIATNKKRAT